MDLEVLQKRNKEGPMKKLKWDIIILAWIIGIGILLISNIIRPVDHYSCVVGILSVGLATIAAQIYNNHK